MLDTYNGVRLDAVGMMRCKISHFHGSEKDHFLTERMTGENRPFIKRRLVSESFVFSTQLYAAGSYDDDS